MKVFIAKEDEIIYPACFTSLRECCKHLGVSYSSASQGKKVWTTRGKIIQIIELPVIKIKGRGAKANKIKINNQ